MIMSSFVKLTFCSLFSVQLKGTFGSRARVTKSRSLKSRSTLIQIIVTVCDTVSYNNTKCMHNICTCRYHIVFIYVYILVHTHDIMTLLDWQCRLDSALSGYPRIFAVGDCNYSCVDEPGKKPDEWPIPPIPKISYPGEEMLLGK